MNTKTTRAICCSMLLFLAAVGCKENEKLSDPQLLFATQKLFSNDNDRFPDYNTFYKVPDGFSGKTFELSQDYPQTYDGSNVKYPWQEINFTDKNKYEDYMNTVLKYCLEENVDNDFKVQKNTSRKWYHAPWMHNDDQYIINTNKDSLYVGAGREALRGLTQEITSKPGQLHDLQTHPSQTWAVSFYNEPGGYTFGKVWKEKTPNIDASDFPEGTVCFKLIFTDAPVEEVPFLKGSLEWDAHIYDNTVKKNITGKLIKKVRLIQVDIAVKDSRAKDTQWAFGTFIYNNAKKGEKWYEKLEPVGIGWDNDVDELDDINKFPNNFINNKLKENIVNPSLIKNEKSVNHPDQAYVTHLGIGGRMNGPVDNQRASCISCHSRAALNSNYDALDLADFSNNAYNATMFKEFFQNVKGGVQTINYNGKDYKTSDFSFQISMGIRNYQNHLRILKQIPNSKLQARKVQFDDVITASEATEQLPIITRGGIIEAE
ncbi:hypothetical protein [Chryseobacterium luquanense]|uniref:Cytochrome c domain-containing protein n=1 Tax=Chryseobacterium luquanense TaxID=2983766 RepID=A0ABT3Y9H6_9FLAO|nr:hypothetical protein [Chryseobacterium luquanense]MCX8534651.1 hypothetical protein [Chryseobacterium luquanense]